MDVIFDNKSAFDDFGLRFSKLEIQPPSPKRTSVSVPYMDGELDLTYALSDEIRYENREITITFYIVDLEKNWHSNYGLILNYLHGKKHRVVFSDDTDWYWDCFCEVDSVETKYQLGIVVLRCTAFPYKKKESTITRSITTSGNITITNNRMRTIPQINTSNAIRIEFENKSIAIPAGESISTDIVFKEGRNVLNIIGTTNITLTYTEGAL